MTRRVKQVAWLLRQSQLRTAEMIGDDYKENSKNDMRMNV